MSGIAPAAVDPASGSARPDGVGRDGASVIRLRDVRKQYEMGGETVHALAGVSLSIERGAFWMIMGASGSGKSTMLNLLGCLDRPTSGVYELAGQDVAALDDNRLSELRLGRLGFVFQNFNLIPQLTVRENIELPMHYLDTDAAVARERAEALAARVGLGERLGHRPTQLSGGQQQRVAIARALANGPAVLLADEPTGNLDSATGAAIMALLTELHEGGTTIVMVTHEPDIAAYGTHQLHMRDGRVERIETNAGGARP